MPTSRKRRNKILNIKRRHPPPRARTVRASVPQVQLMLHAFFIQQPAQIAIIIKKRISLPDDQDDLDLAQLFQPPGAGQADHPSADHGHITCWCYVAHALMYRDPTQSATPAAGRGRAQKQKLPGRVARGQAMPSPRGVA